MADDKRPEPVADVLVEAVHKAITSRQLLDKRLKKSRPIVEVHIAELDDPDDAENPETWILMQAMSGTRKEDWQFRRIAEERYEPDQELSKQLDRKKTWGEVIKGNKQSLIAESVVDEHGRVLYSQADVAELAAGNAAAIERMYAKAVQLNGMPRDNIPAYLVKWLEETDAGARPEEQPLGAVAKNSAGGRTKDSSSN